MEPLKPNQKRAQWAIILIGLILLTNFISLYFYLYQYQLISAVQEGKSISIEEANASDLKVNITVIVNLVLYIISILTFVLWFRRAYYNLHQRADYLSFTEGWAAGSWFVPFISLYRPYQIMKELYTKTQEIVEQKGSTIQLNTSILGLWWFLWLFDNFLARYISKIDHDNSLNTLINLSIWNMINEILSILLALVTIKVIRDYSIIEPLLSTIARTDDSVLSENPAEYKTDENSVE